MSAHIHYAQGTPCRRQVAGLLAQVARSTHWRHDLMNSPG